MVNLYKIIEEDRSISLQLITFNIDIQ